MGESTEFEKGHTAGGIDERLAGHDKHFAMINGSLDKLDARMGEVALGMQRLSDQATAAAATVLTTAAALKAAEDARRAKGEATWTPLARVISVLGVLIGIAGIFLAIYANAGK